MLMFDINQSLAMMLKDTALIPQNHAMDMVVPQKHTTDMVGTRILLIKMKCWTGYLYIADHGSIEISQVTSILHI